MFSEGVASRHIPKCAGIKAKPRAIKRSAVKQKRPPTAPAVSSSRRPPLRNAPRAPSTSSDHITMQEWQRRDEPKQRRNMTAGNNNRRNDQPRRTLAWEQEKEEGSQELPSELDQLHAMGDRKFGNNGGGGSSSLNGGGGRRVQYTRQNGGRDDGERQMNPSRQVQNQSRQTNQSRGSTSSTESALAAVAAAAAAAEEQDAMTEKISRLKNELDELDQLLYGKKRHR